MSVPNTGRVQLALNVSDLEGSVAFYAKLFNTDPAKRKPGYANFAIDQPPLKLVLIENVDGGSINHLGVEVEDTDLVRQAGERFSVTGMDTDVENSVECCYAVQDKVWVTAPDGERWEYYTVLNDSETMRSASTEDACCAGTPAACC
ncbi:MAG: ArsI/CadI family heavy metal resistance metalloenzyme [Acidimicrobiia bacterium]